MYVSIFVSSFLVFPFITTTYTLTCSGSGGSVTGYATVEVQRIIINLPHELNVVNGSGDGKYYRDTNVDISADRAPSGKVFDKWIGAVANPTLPSTTIRMPSTDTTVTATYKTIPAPPSGGGGCFLAGTKIRMADGSWKYIEDIRQGDSVMSYDLERGRLVRDSVSELLIHPNDREDYLIVNGVLNNL